VGTPRYEADRQVFRQTRALNGSNRWKLAQNDDNSAGILKDLSCAIGVELTAKNAPTLARMIPRVGRDSSRLTNLPKDALKRQRPFLIDRGPVCIAKPDSYDYPSGHVTWGWTVGLIMAELAPDRATDILIRARAFGESRLVCGVHNLSAIEAGRTNGSIIVAALHGEPEFRKDLEAARSEVAAARKAGPAPDAAACKAEAALLKSPY
jgi:acid phosphatase (class A)